MIKHEELESKYPYYYNIFINGKATPLTVVEFLCQYHKNVSEYPNKELKAIHVVQFINFARNYFDIKVEHFYQQNLLKIIVDNALYVLFKPPYMRRYGSQLMYEFAESINNNDIRSTIGSLDFKEALCRCTFLRADLGISAQRFLNELKYSPRPESALSNDPSIANAQRLGLIGDVYHVEKFGIYSDKALERLGEVRKKDPNALICKEERYEMKSFYHINYPNLYSKDIYYVYSVCYKK